MKRWTPVFAVLVLFAAVAVASLPPSWKAALPGGRPAAIAQPAQAPKFAADWAAAFCRWDAVYLSANGTGMLTASAEKIAAAAGLVFDSCDGVRYLGALSPMPSSTRQAFVLHVTDGAGTHDEVWVFQFDTDGKAVHFDYAD